MIRRRSRIEIGWRSALAFGSGLLASKLLEAESSEEAGVHHAARNSSKTLRTSGAGSAGGGQI
jgi:hypothetical protein